MANPLRALLLVLAFPAAVLLAIVGHDWYERELAAMPPPAPPVEGVQHPAYADLGVRAAQRFAALEPGARTALRYELETRLLALDVWLEKLRDDAPEIVCLGERHTARTRRFLAANFFAEVPADTVALEASSRDLEEIERRMRNNKARVYLLGADIREVINAARRVNPQVHLAAIEETSQQRSERRDGHGTQSRDEAIAVNFEQIYRKGHRHLILYGALHCADDRDWLYSRLRARAPSTYAGTMLSVRVIGDHEEGLMEAFTDFLGRIGIEREAFAVVNPRAIDARVKGWFPSWSKALAPYDVLVVFRM